MILDPADAQRFIRWYSLLLLELLGAASHQMQGSLVAMLVRGRMKLMKQPALLQEAKAKLAPQYADFDFDVVKAVESLNVRKWVYLRDTKLHSIFVDEATERAFGVVGLTERLRDILGGSGVWLEAGV